MTVFSYNHNDLIVVHNNYQINYDDNADKVIKDLVKKGEISEDSDVSINSTLNKDYELFGGNSDVIAEYDYKFEVKNIGLGEYDLTKSNEAKIIIGLFVNHLDYLKSLYEIEGHIEVAVLGEADGTGFKNEKKYLGEYGNFYSSKTIIDSKGNFSNISISEGEMFNDNLILAFLRANSAWSMVKQKTDIFTYKNTNLITKSFVNRQFGGDFRRIKVVVKLKEIKKKHTTKAEKS